MSEIGEEEEIENLEVLKDPKIKNLNKQTAKAAEQLLNQRDKRYIKPTATQKRIIVREFAKKNKIVYGRAFDMVYFMSGVVDLNEPTEVAKNIKNLTLVEIKSTRKPLNENFSRYFFGLSTAELLTAQNLGDQYKFVFVNIIKDYFKEMQLNEIFANAKKIYPTWSIELK